MAVNRPLAHCNNSICRTITRPVHNTPPRTTTIISMACPRRRSHKYRNRLCRCRRHLTITTIQTTIIRITISSAVNRTQMPTGASSTTAIRSIITRRQVRSQTHSWLTIKINSSVTIVRPLQLKLSSKHRPDNLDSIAMRRISNSRISYHFWTINA